MFELFDVWKGPKKAALGDRVLAGATAVIPDGRRIGLLGADANRNSMVLRLLAGVDEPDKGVIRRTGVPCWPFEYSGFSDNSATLRQNAQFLGRLYGVDGDEVARIAIELSGVKPSKGKPLRLYLGPERRALELGLTLSIQFDWYFVDGKLPKAPEETEAAVQAAIADRVGRASLIWASTNPKVLKATCDAGLVLDQGLLTFYDSFEQAAEAFEYLTASQDKDQDDGQSGGKKRRRRAARRARKDSAEEPV